MTNPNKPNPIMQDPTAYGTSYPGVVCVGSKRKAVKALPPLTRVVSVEAAAVVEGGLAHDLTNHKGWGT